MISQGKFLIEASKLLLRQKDEWTDSSNQRIKTLLSTLESIYHSFPKHEFVKYSKGVGSPPQFNLIERKQFIYLPPVTKDKIILPVMSINCDLSGTQPKLSLRIMLLFFQNNDHTNSIKSIGYRYETPEEAGTNRSRHDYYHAQPITKFDRNHSEHDSFCDQDILEKTPAFPLDAKTPATLFMSMLISLYGVNDPTVQDIYRLLKKKVRPDTGIMHTELEPQQ
ncbi:MAG: hypothetical protein IAE79_20245 [Anaerolinea sp.]|nr:hypothetical protein [Anaerolinea sp.]